ncbi:MAG: hypothetical protein AAGF23_06130, partial [Acidobacteriota bacterium]
RLAAWCPGRLTGADVARLARRVTGQMRTEVFLHSVLERWLWQRPSARPAFTDAELDELESAVGSHPRWRHSMELLRRRASRASAATGERPARPSPTAARFVVVQNLDIGQGDEIFRLGPLLAMLLTLAPGATIDLVTRRRHLWDHPRIRAVSIDDEGAVRESLDAADGFAWTDEPAAFGILRLDWLPAAIRGRAAGAPWVLEMTTRNTHPVFRRLRLGGVDWLPELRPGSPPRDAYDTLERLALRLGVPWIGDAADGTGADGGPVPVSAAFVGRASEEAGPAIADLGGDGARPLAVVQPFGGFTEVKGYTRGEGPRLARELEALVDEGFRVVILPVVEAWGKADRVRGLVGRMAPAQARHVAVAPDPSDPPAWLTERPELAGADRVMRFFKYLIARADLVAAVEGWVCHLGSLLGRPVRVVLRAGSFTPDWYPRGARWSAALSEGCGPDRPEGLASGSKAPVLSLSDRGLLGLALAGIGRRESLERLVPRLAASADPEVRAMAIRAARPWLEVPDFAAIATRALVDPAPAVRRAAADTWLARGDLESRWPAPRPTLEAHRAIAAARWADLDASGAAALAALAVAARGHPDFIRRQSRRLLQAMLRDRAGGRSGASSAPPPGAP